MAPPTAPPSRRSIARTMLDGAALAERLRCDRRARTFIPLGYPLGRVPSLSSRRDPTRLAESSRNRSRICGGVRVSQWPVASLGLVRAKVGRPPASWRARSIRHPLRLARGVGQGFADLDGVRGSFPRRLCCPWRDLRDHRAAGVRGRGERHGEADEPTGRDSDRCGPASGRVLARSPGDRARRLRDLATPAGRARPWSGGGGQHPRAARRTRERPCLRRACASRRSGS